MTTRTTNPVQVTSLDAVSADPRHVEGSAGHSSSFGGGSDERPIVQVRGMLAKRVIVSTPLVPAMAVRATTAGAIG